MIAYFDTSALVKLVLNDEEGGDIAADVWSGADGLVTSRLAYPEARAALASADRARRVSAQVHASVRRELDGLFAEVELVELTDDIARAAGELADRFALGGADAVHLGSALAVMSGEDGVLLSWDGRLRDAAGAAGLAVAPAAG